MTNRLAGNPSSTAAGPTPYTVAPTTAAATRASAPMLTDRTLATTNTRTSTPRAMTSGDIVDSYRVGVWIPGFTGRPWTPGCTRRWPALPELRAGGLT